MSIRFNNSYARLPERFYSRLNPAKVPQPRLIQFNAELVEQFGIDPKWMDSVEATQVFAGNLIAAGSEPLAQAYAGHQFGGWLPRLGDGRAILLGEVLDRHGKRFDIQLKGSGRTPFSRGGDGKAALGPAMREYLVSEAMHHLGIPTTRALALLTTGEKVFRETALDGAIFVRVAASHIRVGTFQYLANCGDIEGLRLLTDHALQRHYSDDPSGLPTAIQLLDRVIQAQAKLVARWMGLGFIHGVMNTDNMTISGETIDFGPCAFMDSFHPRCVYSAIDSHGRYAWVNQPAIAQWNLTRLAECLMPLISDNHEAAEQQALQSLSRFGPLFNSSYHAIFASKLGLISNHGRSESGNTLIDENESNFINETLTMLASQELDFTLFFQRLTESSLNDDSSKLFCILEQPDILREWWNQWEKLRMPENAERSTVMRSVNPVIIPRNHWVERAIQHGYQGDFSVFHRLVEAWKNPFSKTPQNADLECAPLPEERVHQTFCGT